MLIQILFVYLSFKSTLLPKMKKVLLFTIVLSAVFSVKLSAQREPQQTQYMLNKLSFNPAYAGTQGNKICATMLYHNQWANFKSTEDASTAPKTLFFNAHSPIQIGNNEFGLGIQIISDNLGFEKNTTFGASGSYHKKFKFATASVGLSVNVSQLVLNGAWKQLDQNDPLIKNGSLTGTSFGIGSGIYLYDPKWYAGLSFQNMNNPSLPWGKISNVPPAMYTTGGYNYRIKNTKLDLLPSILVRTDFKKTQLDVSCLVQYNQQIFAGLNYHSGDAIALIGGVNYKSFTIGASYDLTTSDASPFGGKLEFLVKYCFQLNLVPNEIIFHKSPRFL